MKHCYYIFLCASFTISSLSVAQTSVSAANEAWFSLAPINEPTARHENAFIAHQGGLYLLGGRGVKPVQRYDPGTNAWSSGAYPPLQLHHFQAVTYRGLIYAIGAYSGTCCDAEFGVSHIYTYNPGTDTWAQGDPIPQARRRGSTAAVVHNDKIYIIGGLEGGHGTPATSFSWFDEYDPMTGDWKILPNAPRKRDHFHATVLNNKLYLVGGRDTSDPSIVGKMIPEIDVFNFNTGTWSTLPAENNIPTLRGGATAVVYNNEIVVLGGESPEQQLAHATVESFDPVSGLWRTLPNLNVGRHGTQASTLDGNVYIAAGAAQKGGAPELNSAERFQNTTNNQVTVVHELQPGWNLVSLPLAMSETLYDELYQDIPLKPNYRPFSWEDGYARTSSMEFGKAYWLRLERSAEGVQQQALTGTPVTAREYNLQKGWNMIGSLSCDNVSIRGVSTNPVGAIPPGALFYFDGAYRTAFTPNYPRGILNQGYGYWIKTNQNATLNLDCGSSKHGMDAPVSFNTITGGFDVLYFYDETGKQQELYLGGRLDHQDAVINFALPPRAPEGYFDIRFSDNTRLTESTRATVSVQAGSTPIRVMLKEGRGHNSSYRLSFISQGAQRGETVLTGDNSWVLDPDLDAIEVTRLTAGTTETATLPDAIHLHGNYPNPFNPVTRIVFDLPEDARVSVQVFNMIGQQVLEIPARPFEAGALHSIPLNAESLTTGHYVYRLLVNNEQQVTSTRTGTFSLVR